MNLQGMKRIIQMGALALGIVFISMIGTNIANASQLPVTQLKAAQDSNHIVLVVGSKKDKTKVWVNDYTKDEAGNWTRNWRVTGICGKNGIAVDKVEGDKKTPEGVFQATMNFGLLDNPGSKLLYHKIATGDFWVDDPNSAYYNKLVNISTTAKDWNSAENLIEASPYYNYGIALDYNKEAVPGKGSAVFIHRTKTNTDTYSAGCIRIPEEYVIKLVNTIDEKTKIVILENVDKLTLY